MTVDLSIVNAKIPTKQGLLDGGIAIENGKIYRLAKKANLPEASDKVNVHGNLIFPGLIDAHVHLRDLGLSYKEDFYSGTCSAAAGGFTTVLDMPNTKPPTNSALRLKEKMDRARSKIVTNIGFYVGFPAKSEDFGGVTNLGPVGFKVIFCHPSTGINIEDDSVLFKAFKEAAKVNLPVAVHAEDHLLVKNLEAEFKRAGKNSSQAYLESHPPIAEIKSVKRVLNLAKKTLVRIHFCHVSVADVIDMIKAEKSATCEVTPHHLFLTDKEVPKLGGIALMNPPLRAPSHANELWRDLTSGIIDIVASDHAPHTIEEKRSKDVWRIPPGIPGLETTLPLLLTRLNRGEISLRLLIKVLSEKPAEIFHLKGKGTLDIGSDADLTIVDLKQSFVIDSAKFHSKAKYTPFDGWKVTGRAAKTFVGGKLVMEDGEIVADPGVGHVIRVK